MYNGVRKKIFTLSLLAAVLSATAAHAAERDGATCGRAIVAARMHVARADTRRLTRCALAALERETPGDVPACAALAQPETGFTIARHRNRVERRCAKTLPAWLPATCPGPGPEQGSGLHDGEAVARCAIGSAHCLAWDAAVVWFPELEAELEAHADANEAAEPGGFDFLDCSKAPSTTTTLPASSTTLPAPTTTLPAPTTTLPAPTTTLPAPTTTLPAPTTTLPAPTTTLPAPTTTLPPMTTSTVPAATTTVPSPTTTTTLSATPALVVSEIMSNPAAQSDTVGEYVEIYNAGETAVDLLGLVVRDDGSDLFMVTASVVVAPGAYAVLGKSATAAAGAVDFVYGSAMTLANTSDVVVLEIDGSEIDRAAYSAGYPLVAGRSAELRAEALDSEANDTAAAWCASTVPLGDGDFGSPRAQGSCAP